LDFNRSILKDIRAGVGLDASASDFDTDILIHINSAIGRLNQNGIGNFLVVEDEAQTWDDLRNLSQVAGNQYFKMIPSFITISTKLLFDPPPPSAVHYHSDNVDKTLWRLKLAYEEPYVPPITEGSDY
jgi:hypothetical protein